MTHTGIRPYRGRFFMLFFLLNLVLCFGQKRLMRTYDAGELTKLEIDADKLFEVELETIPGEQIRVETFIEGEYQRELTISAKQDGSTLFLQGVFMPSFENPNDKLSAHKVLSLRLKIQVPLHLSLDLYGYATRVVASGYYQELDIRTQKGPVFLESVKGLVKVKTATGDIRAKGVQGYLQAISAYGEVYKGNLQVGDSNIRLESTNGDIYINKEE